MRFTLRRKLLVVALAALSIPYVGFEYLRETERYLRRNLERNLAESVAIVAGPLQERPDLFPDLGPAAGPQEGALFVHRLGHAIQVDGYADDWSDYLDWADRYAANGRVRGAGHPESDHFSFKLTAGSHDDYLYVFLQVQDPSPVLPRAQDELGAGGDRVEMIFSDRRGALHRYVFATPVPGTVVPREIVRTPGAPARSRPVTNVSAEWQPHADGYNLEIQMPEYQLGGHLGFVVTDVTDRKAPRRARTAATAGASTAQAPGRLVRTSLELEALIRASSSAGGRRIWVLDASGQVLASTGTLQRRAAGEQAGLLYSLLLPPVSENFTDDLARASRLQGAEVRAALSGQAETRWRSSPDGRAAIVSAAHPVRVGGHVRGAVVVEATANSIQTLQRHAMANLFNKTVAVVLLATFGLLWFASRLSLRLSRLSRDADAAIDAHGRVLGDVQASGAGDEIGDLSRTISAMLRRLRQYHEYLESMAGKLSHELRTPIAVVRSSLENLETEAAGADSAVYVNRAKEGIERLDLLVARLSEASRLEHALQASEMQDLDLAALVRGCADGYRDAYPETGFEVHVPAHEIAVRGAPELMVQMLDKIIANARDFNRAERPVIIRLTRNGSKAVLQVENFGARLPEEMVADLFNSMVSFREGKGKEPHLGLGLYIVRLIAEFHGASVSAANLDAGDGVRVSVAFPLA